MPRCLAPFLCCVALFICALPALAAEATERAHTLTGHFQLNPRFHSRFLQNDRDVMVYLPPGYESHPKKRYPVLYMQDGQNLFDGATAFIPGKEWRMDESAEALIAAGEIQPLLIVAIDHAGIHRMDEYTPTRSQKYNAGGGADHYGRMLVEELKPFIDAHYRTLKDPGNTGLGGSSLGGLVALCVGLDYPKTFGKLAILSPSLWWDDGFILKEAGSLPRKLPLKIWLDIGGGEEKEAIDNCRALCGSLGGKGWKLNGDLLYYEEDGAKHEEEAWAARVPKALKYLFPAPVKR